MLLQIGKYASLGVLLVLFVVSAHAQTKSEPRKSTDTAPRDRSAGDAVDRERSPASTNQYSDRDRRAGWEKGKEDLERTLKPGQDKQAYRQALEKAGWKITAVNYDKPDYAEWEIVKGDQTYEVQLDLKNNKATKIDVATNMWKAKATEEALRSASGARAQR